jgi:DNA-directed RNA polymerase specialized sigma24 family protein
VVDLLLSLSNPPRPFLRLAQLVTEPVKDEPAAEPVRELYQPQTRLTEVQRDELIRRYIAGERAFELAIDFGLHRVTVANVLVRAGKRRSRLMTQPECADAIRLYAEGWTCARIGEELDRSKDAVRRALHAADVELRPSRYGS